MPQDEFVKPKVKQAVISADDVKPPAPVAQVQEGPARFRVKIAGLRGQYQGVHFSDDCIAENVDPKHLSELQGHFGESSIEVLTQDQD